MSDENTEQEPTPAEETPPAEAPAEPSLEQQLAERTADLQRLQADGRLVATELSHELGVSIDTVRRDLRELAEGGLVRRVRGGALPAVAGARPYEIRAGQATAATLTRPSMMRASYLVVRIGSRKLSLKSGWWQKAADHVHFPERKGNWKANE